MNNLRLFPLLALALLLALAGCGNFGQYLDTTPLPAGSQVLNGTVTWPAGVTLPADAAITVLLFDDAGGNVLATQRIARPGVPPLAFQLPYKGEDLDPPHRVRVEARISVGGRLSYASSRQQNFLTPASIRGSIALTVTPLSGGAPSGPPAADAGNYVVKAGDTAASITQQLGLTIMELALANPAVDITKLKVGQKLSVPAAK